MVWHICGTEPVAKQLQFFCLKSMNWCQFWFLSVLWSVSPLRVMLSCFTSCQEGGLLNGCNGYYFPIYIYLYLQENFVTLFFMSGSGLYWYFACLLTVCLFQQGHLSFIQYQTHQVKCANVLDLWQISERAWMMGSVTF